MRQPSFRQFLEGPPSQLSEGFFDFSVNGSDTSADLFYDVKKVLSAEKRKLSRNKLLPTAAVEFKLAGAATNFLKKYFDEDVNNGDYNTHGTLNVAMIMDEYFHEFRKFQPWQDLAGAVADKLYREAKHHSGEYRRAMEALVPKLIAIHKEGK